MNIITHFGPENIAYEALDSQLDMLEECCNEMCNQGRLCPRRVATDDTEKTKWMVLLALAPLAVIAAVATIQYGAQSW